MGAMKTVTAAAVAGVGTLAALGAIENMDSGKIRDVGSKISSAVRSAGSWIMETDTAKDLKAKIAGTEYGGTALQALNKIGDTVSTGFDGFIGAVADCKENAENNGTSFTGEVFSKLSDAVSTGADYIAESMRGGSPEAGDGVQAPEAQAEAEPQAQTDDMEVSM